MPSYHKVAVHRKPKRRITPFYKRIAIGERHLLDSRLNAPSYVLCKGAFDIDFNRVLGL